MSINFRPQGIYGSVVHKDERFTIVASKIQNKWFAAVDKELYAAGFNDLDSLGQFYDKFEQYVESLNMLGYSQDGILFTRDPADSNHVWSQVKLLHDGYFTVEFGKGADSETYSSNDFHEIENYILQKQEEYGIDIFSSITIVSPEKTQYVIECKMSSRDLSKNLVRVKSSNLWSYGIDIKDRKDKTGNVIVQFKNSHGGPGDLYQYLDVPVNVWRKWLGATSKGAFLWKFIRNEYNYRKLTGDKRGKLPNAIN